MLIGYAPKDIKGAIMQGRLIAVCGVVGSGKTVTVRRLQQILKDENRVTVAKSISVEKHSIKLATLITALYYDLAQDKLIQIPSKSCLKRGNVRWHCSSTKRTI
jgi:type II secretory pathway predicted ATPase ExeA